MNSNPTWRYRLCLRLVSPLLVLHCICRGFNDGGWRYVKQRFGFAANLQQQRILIHAASVGEVITVIPLIEKLKIEQPDTDLVVTTNTPTGAAVLFDRLGNSVEHTYFPIDFSGATKRFFTRQNISDIWVVETEIWPWFFARAKQADIPVSIINARLSPKSRGALANFFHETYKQALSDICVLARSAEDVQNFVARGAAPNQVHHIGNLKFGNTAYANENTTPLLSLPYALAASTHDDEELLIAQSWLESRDNGLLVIAPRHAERGARLLKSLNALQQDIDPTLPAPALRSLQQFPEPQSRIYIADTLGELSNWYAHATAAFVGGSLIKRGGHNVLEPAYVRTLIIVGPHTFNFKDEVYSLEQANAIALANNANEVIGLFALAESHPQWAQTLANNAFNFINDKSDIVDTYYESLQ